MRSIFNLAQVRNPDPFAIPAWRSPVYRTPAWIITLVILARLAWKLARFAARHPRGRLRTSAGAYSGRVGGTHSKRKR